MTGSLDTCVRGRFPRGLTRRPAGLRAPGYRCGVGSAAICFATDYATARAAEGGAMHPGAERPRRMAR